LRRDVVFDQRQRKNFFSRTFEPCFARNCTIPLAVQPDHEFNGSIWSGGQESWSWPGQVFNHLAAREKSFPIILSNTPFHTTQRPPQPQFNMASARLTYTNHSTNHNTNHSTNPTNTSSLMDDMWDDAASTASTLVGDEGAVNPPTRLVSSPRPTSEWLYDLSQEDAFNEHHRTTARQLPPALEPFEDLFRTQQAGASPPTPILRPTNATHPSEPPGYSLPPVYSMDSLHSGPYPPFRRIMAGEDARQHRFQSTPRTRILVVQEPARDLRPTEVRYRPQAQARAPNQAYETSLLPPIRRRNETMDGFVARLGAHMAYIRNFTRNAGLGGMDRN
jgi:hypothetical protein